MSELKRTMWCTKSVTDYDPLKHSYPSFIPRPQQMFDSRVYQSGAAKSSSFIMRPLLSPGRAGLTRFMTLAT